ncbi:hypothetical protein TNCV_4257281 [Trichonephila clavipes]|nr:hypothetical protein TNCV_4257281 [Trichonephila clavipes]
MKKSKELKSGERGEQATGPLLPAHLSGYVSWRWLRITLEKCLGAPSRINNAFRAVGTGSSPRLTGQPSKGYYYGVFPELNVVCIPIIYGDLSSMMPSIILLNSSIARIRQHPVKASS